MLWNMVSRIYTIGHSTRSIEDFVAALVPHGIKLISDVRLLPGSKRYPQFNRDALADSLGEHGIAYEHFPELGGRRKPRPDSPNTAWRNAAFRGYADHMATGEFQTGLGRLLATAEQSGPTAIMCAEAVWWRCHRILIADLLKSRGLEVVHIIDAKKTERHPYTSAAGIVDGVLSYSANQGGADS
jgi:uncharacterized protein (DUF488 family)